MGRLPIRSLRSSDPEVTESLQRDLYLTELDRQAQIVSLALGNAWQRAVMPETDSDDWRVWADLQAALFAGIVISRVLKPTSVWKIAHLSREASKLHADARGVDLREALGIGEDWPLFKIACVRDALEHVDERLDEVIIRDAVSISDWFISEGSVLVGAAEAEPSSDSDIGLHLRVFFPAGGVLGFHNQYLDLFAIDECANDLRTRIAGVRSVAPRGSGTIHFGGMGRAYLMDRDTVELRLNTWRQHRARVGMPISVPAEFEVEAQF